MVDSGTGFARCLMLAWGMFLALPANTVIAAGTAIESVQVLALTRDRAILAIDGERRVLGVGEVSREGVHLLRSTSGFAVVEIEGSEYRLEPGVVTAPVDLAGSESAPVDDTVVLWSDSHGFFHADGEINGRMVRFLVDTGANTIALSSKTARDIGLDISTGQPARARTVSGIVDITSITLEQVSIGPITLHHVDAGVIEGDYPVSPLLGASFLNHVEMRRAGIRMELQKK
jgi:aspartyl protease family protein